MSQKTDKRLANKVHNSITFKIKLHNLGLKTDNSLEKDNELADLGQETKKRLANPGLESDKCWPIWIWNQTTG